MVDCFERSQIYRTRMRKGFHRLKNYSLTLFYLSIRILYIGNVLFQLIFLEYFLSFDGKHFSRTILDFSFGSSNWKHLFPRVTLCDFQIRELANKHQYTVECILVINIFIEKALVVFLIWSLFLILVTLFDTFGFIYKTNLRHSRDVFIRQNLEVLIEKIGNKESQQIEFIRRFSADELLVLRLISQNKSSLIVGAILRQLFRRHLKIDEQF